MKLRIKKIFLAAILLLPMACVVDDNYELGSLLTADQISFRVEQDLTSDPGGNTVILINDTPETVPIWDYGIGRSTRQQDTVRFAFAGDYEIKLSFVTGGGIVELDPVMVNVSEDNLNYVDDPLWTALSGGVGEEKTWILDIDANFFDGPLFFYGADNGYLLEGDSWDGGDTGCYGEDCWAWEPDYAENTWLMDYGDYGTMTFSLDGGPYVQVNHNMLPNRGLEEGTYFLNVEDKTLTLTDAAILHNSGNADCVNNWGNTRIFSLTENAMQLGVLRRDDCDGAAMLVYNFVSQDYLDSLEEE
ncbi:hypothetical protein [Arthrospiribacter ruber]|uniref:PKD domain-containing protein n=1 Tax=Arthrospiribacter ruber TaxID=2487934 RepID=A0A951MK78_9BACT|nr:hypothetical protein [Arthrospiribacter ruber]MBW3466817.1 hypothetical protein [Arthrospiribacter ruber]MBW3469609.1 hypothetical protein [Arthrospiribacter ruber]MBW3470316.1 hypothetical protein [Arthrospiribacter ruber]